MCTDIVRYNKSWNLGHLSEPDGGSFFFSHELKLRSKAVTKCFIGLSNHRLKWKFSLCAIQDLTILILQNFNIYPIQRERIQNIICLSYSPRGCQYQFKAIIIWVGNILYMFIWKIFITECIHKVGFPEIYLKKKNPPWLLKWNVLKNCQLSCINTSDPLKKISHILWPL